MAACPVRAADIEYLNSLPLAAIDDIFESIARGTPVVAVLGELRVSTIGFYKWIRKNPERAEAFDPARQAAANTMAQETIAIARRRARRYRGCAKGKDADSVAAMAGVEMESAGGRSRNGRSERRG